MPASGNRPPGVAQGVGWIAEVGDQRGNQAEGDPGHHRSSQAGQQNGSVDVDFGQTRQREVRGQQGQQPAHTGISHSDSQQSARQSKQKTLSYELAKKTPASGA